MCLLHAKNNGREIVRELWQVTKCHPEIAIECQSSLAIVIVNKERSSDPIIIDIAFADLHDKRAAPLDNIDSPLAVVLSNVRFGAVLMRL